MHVIFWAGEIAAAAALFLPAQAFGQPPVPEVRTATESPSLGELSPSGAETSSAAPSGGELDLFRLDELLHEKVVTAAGTEEDRTLAAANVISFTKADIARRGWRSLAEILENVPGLYLVDDLVTTSIGVRGLTGGLRAGTRIVKVMIDGFAVNFRPDLTAFIGPEFIPIEAIERVEVAKGPLSALYGANAFLATVNVITRKSDPWLNATVTGRAGFDRGRAGVGSSGAVGYGTENAGILVAFSVDEIDRSGLSPQRVLASTPDADIFAQKSSNDQAQPASGFFQLRAGSETLGWLLVQAGLQRLDANGEFQLNSVLTHQSRITIDNLWATAHYQKKWTDEISTALQIGFSRGTPTRDYRLFLTGTNAASFKPNYDYRALDASLEMIWAAAEWLTLKAGVDAEIDDERVLYYTQTFNERQGAMAPGSVLDLIGADDPHTQTLHDIGAYVQLTGTPVSDLPGLHVTANGRIDQIAQGPATFPLEYSWRTAVAYRWSSDLVTKLIAGRAFQTPSGVLMFGHSGYGLANNVIGNLTIPGVPPLVPQLVTSVEAVASAWIFERLTLEGGLYYQLIQDKIEFIQSGTDFAAANRGDQASVGLEGNARFAYGPLSPYLSLSIARRITDGSLDSSAPELYPNAFGRAGIDVELPDYHVFLNAQVRYVSERGASQSNVYLNNRVPYALPAYANVDVTVSTIGLHLFGDQAETKLILTVKNLLDERHAEPGFGGVEFGGGRVAFEVPNLGRVVYLAIRQSF